MDSLNIYPSVRNQLGAFAGSLVFLAGGIWMLSHGDLTAKQAIAAWLGILFGGGAALCIAWLLFRHYTRRQPLLRLDEQGITFFDVRKGETTVGWERIAGFGECRVVQQRFITVVVHDAEAVVEAESSPVRRKMLEFNIRYCGAPYSIVPASLDYPKKQLLQTLETYHSKYR